ncbi:MAG: Uma2 family endonuclease [Chloroflexi bacterium]|nr:Uma2 family endonuclease [Chloroflexota bacterium]
MTTTTTITAEQLSRMPDNATRRELVRGELREMAPAGNVHGRVAMKAGWRLAQHVESHNLGVVYAAETGFILARNPDTVRAPDVAFVRQEVVDAMSGVVGYLPCAPDLAIEVISPGDSYTEVNEKVMEWLGAGSRMVVTVDPRRRIVTVYRSRHDIEILTEEDTLSGGDVVEGWELPLSELFA